jgi:hypothetical protein
LYALKNDDVGWVCSTHGGKEKMHTEFCSENLKGRHYSEDLGMDWRIILEWILGK